MNGVVYEGEEDVKGPTIVAYYELLLRKMSGGDQNLRG